MSKLEKKISDAVFLKPNFTIKKSINKISELSQSVKCPGIGIILDQDKTLLGIITDGDIRRSYSKKIDFSLPVSKIMNKEPIVLPDDTKINDIVSSTRKAVQKRKYLKNDHVKYVILVDQNNKYVEIFDYLNLILSNASNLRSVAVIGMGYVGLTLSIALSSKGHDVTGVDIKKNIVLSLTKGVTDIVEPGLNNILKLNSSKKKIKFRSKLANQSFDVYVICIGTSINKNKPNIRNIISLCGKISKKLKKGDQVMIRSTVPVGSTRNYFVPMLQKFNNLKAGLDFSVSFTPERTIEGNALEELRSLPQIVGGLTPLCLNKASNFWTSITSKIIQSESLEAAELIKLANNTFRDVSFNFANELSILCSRYNINAFDLISSANDGYPRNKISMPSPGVGGYCLTKDPLIYSYDIFTNKYANTLGYYSRKVNDKSLRYIESMVYLYLKKIKKNTKLSKVLIVGLAFKGDPENKDMRDSISIKLIDKLHKRIKNIYCWDGAIKKITSKTNKFTLISDKNFSKISDNADIVLILNNNPKNKSLNYKFENNKNKLIFDGWNQLHKFEIEKYTNVTYATMGYVTKLK
tara:strand:- start:83 stop:1822 length:1740 start_codon:yes stop_codon:yes gene_type:complete